MKDNRGGRFQKKKTSTWWQPNRRSKFELLYSNTWLYCYYSDSFPKVKRGYSACSHFTEGDWEAENRPRQEIKNPTFERRGPVNRNALGLAGILFV